MVRLAGIYPRMQNDTRNVCIILGSIVFRKTRHREITFYHPSSIKQNINRRIFGFCSKKTSHILLFLLDVKILIHGHVYNSVL